MSAMTFFEITTLIGADYAVADRHEIEDALDEALQHAGLGEVTGGGAGLGQANIDAEISDPVRGLAVMRRILQGFSVPSTAIIRQNGCPSIHHTVYDAV